MISWILSSARFGDATIRRVAWLGAFQAWKLFRLFNQTPRRMAHLRAGYCDCLMSNQPLYVYTNFLDI